MGVRSGLLFEKVPDRDSRLAALVTTHRFVGSNLEQDAA